MKIEFYQNTSDENVLDKTINKVTELEGTLTDVTSIINPSIACRLSNEALECNYAYIPDLKRYYFIDSIALMKQNLYMIAMVCDVLMTFKEQILESYGHITRQANFNKYATEYETEDRQEFRKLDFEYEFPENCNLVLITTKGVGAE